MTWRSVGVLSPGEMGAAVATVLRTHGLRVVTCLEGRSARTRQRSEIARLEVVSTLAQLVRTVEAVLSIVPTMSAPAVGEEIAQAITQTSKPISFIEANAISPMTSPAIEQTIIRAGGRYIDGCIIGSARDVGRRTMFYLSGPDAEVTAAALRAGGVQAEVLGGRAGQASALKMGYAGFTKGTTALLARTHLGGPCVGLPGCHPREVCEQPSGGAASVHRPRDDLARVCGHTGRGDGRADSHGQGCGVGPEYGTGGRAGHGGNGTARVGHE
jgi:3-hydroxyisobutyrate dehydrogenase-like beta-hydroxyacid dehydrogenase